VLLCIRVQVISILTVNVLLTRQIFGSNSKSCKFCFLVRGVQCVICIEARSNTPAIGYLDLSKVGRVVFPRNLDIRNFTCIIIIFSEIDLSEWLERMTAYTNV
jgi:hypothetical protein